VRHTVPPAIDMPVLAAILAGQPIEIGVRFPGKTAPVIRSGIVMLNSAVTRNVQSCLDVANARPGK
jgi:hypothetical protein